jgi:uncharacterized protein (TIGR03118 family)
MKIAVDLKGALVSGIGLMVLTVFIGGCGGSGNNSLPINTLPNVYTRTNLVSSVVGFSDSAGPATNTDPNLKNPWGVSFRGPGPFWVSDNGTGVSTLYNTIGTPQSLVVHIPLPNPPQPSGGKVTGQVSNTTGDFAITGGAALFIFATEDGTISAWNTPTQPIAEQKVDNSASGAVYKGLAMGNNGTANFLYAANFHSGAIDVFDTNFAAATLPGAFTDPGAPAGYGPFNIVNIGGSLFVAYAKQDAGKVDEVAGVGNGFISIFDTNGHFLRRLATGSGAGGTVAQLNAPWGMAMAPSGFGQFQGAILVGNFGDGRISAFDSSSGAFLGQLQTSGGAAITIPGLWALIFRDVAGPTLFFSAGINNQADGLFGSIVAGAASRKAPNR